MIKDGGSAFPEIETDEQYSHERNGYVSRTYSYGGMTLRDYFAAKCMADVLSHFSWKAEDIEKAAGFAYKLADAMIQVRKSRA